MQLKCYNCYCIIIIHSNSKLGHIYIFIVNLMHNRKFSKCILLHIDKTFFFIVWNNFFFSLFIFYIICFAMFFNLCIVFF